MSVQRRLAGGWLAAIGVVLACTGACTLDSHGGDAGRPPLSDGGVDAGRDGSVSCCPPSSEPGCCMDFGGVTFDGFCSTVCDGMPLPSAAWELGVDSFGCPVWIEPPPDGQCCGCQQEFDAGGPGMLCGSEVCAPGSGCVEVREPLCGRPQALLRCAPVFGPCDAVLSPVCGCDGVVYSNECEALRAGVEIFASGTCTLP